MQSPFANLSPVVKNLIIINIICFLPSLFYSHGFSGNSDPVAEHFGVYYFNSPLFRPWQVITHMFIHGGWVHIFFNMFVLFSFGPAIEYIMDSRRFLAFYFICGLGSIAMQMAVQAIEVHAAIGGITIPLNYASNDPAIIAKLQGIYTVPMVGASGAIFGVLTAFGIIYPDIELVVLFIPRPVKAKYVISGLVIYELFLGVGQFGGDDVAHFAHLGGGLLGFILIKAWHLQGPKDFRS